MNSLIMLSLLQSLPQSPTWTLLIWPIVATLVAAILIQGGGVIIFQYKLHIENRIKLAEIEATQKANEVGLAKLDKIATSMQETVNNLGDRFREHNDEARQRDEAINKLERIASALETGMNAMDKRVARLERQEDTGNRPRRTQ